MPDYMTHPDTAEARVIWGHRQRGADAALAHLEAAAASLVAAWEINEWPRIAAEAEKLHAQVYPRIGRVAAKHRRPSSRPAIPPPGDEGQS